MGSPYVKAVCIMETDAADDRRQWWARTSAVDQREGKLPKTVVEFRAIRRSRFLELEELRKKFGEM